MGVPRRGKRTPTDAEKRRAIEAQAPLATDAPPAPTAPTTPAVQDKAAGMELRYRRTADLIPYTRNARTHSEAQLAQIAGALREFGFLVPVVTDGANGILAGHGRVLAASKLGLAEVPTVDAAHLTEAQRRAYVLADNKLAERAGWDRDMLAVEVRDLRSMAADLPALGFTDGELKRLTAEPVPEGVADEGTGPAVAMEERAVTQRGQLWELGPHRLICARPDDPEAVKRLLDGAEPHLMLADPEDAATSGAWALFAGDVAYVWTAGGAAAPELPGFIGRAQIAVGRPVAGGGQYRWAHDVLHYGVRKGKRAHWQGGRQQSTWWPDIKPADDGSRPVKAMRRALENSSQPGDLVYAPFVQLGAALLAADQAGRVCLAIEADPLQVDVTVRRWQKQAAAAARLAGDRRTFQEIESDAGLEAGGDDEGPDDAARTQTDADQPGGAAGQSGQAGA